MKLWPFFGCLWLIVLLSCQPKPELERQGVVSTSLLSDEILADLLPPDQIVALSSLALNPQYSLLTDRLEFQTKPLVSINQVEQIVALKPHLVVAAEWADPSALASLKTFGIKVALLKSPTNFTEVYQVIEQLAELTQSGEQADNLINQYKIKELQLAFKTSQQTKKPSLVDYSNPVAVGGANTSIGYVIEQAGFSNAIDQLPGADRYGFLNLSLENLLKLDPDYIYLGYQDPAVFINSNPLVANLKAVKNGHLITLPLQESLEVASVSHRMVDGAVGLQRKL